MKIGSIKETFEKYKSIYRKESPFRNESQGTLTLVRFMSAMLVIYDLLLGAFILYNGILPYALFLFAMVFVNLCAFVSSYKIKATYSLYLLSAVSIVSSIILACGFGWRVSFHTIIFAVLLMLWYNPADGILKKSFFSLLAICLIVFLSRRIPLGMSLFEQGSFEVQALTYANLTVFTICISFVAYFFCTQYTEAERKLYLYNKELKKLSETDPLTKLMNRRYAMEELDELTEKQKEEGMLISIAIGDIDFFKKVNDTYGHDAGDHVLATLSALFRDYMEDKGFVVRWGGEEFLFCFKNHNGDDAMIHVDELRQMIKKTDCNFGGNTINVTMTFGVEEYYNLLGLEDTIKKADEKLYLGKEQGRDRVVY